MDDDTVNEAQPMGETCNWKYEQLAPYPGTTGQAWRSDCGGEFPLAHDHGYIYCPKCGLEIEEADELPE